MRTSKPGAGNKFYIRTANGGYSACIQGSPTDRECNVLANCVGYACGRFNEIIGSMKYPYFNCNAENFIARAKDFYPGLKIEYDVNKGRVGDIVVWGGLGSLAGHVAVIEKVYGPGDYYTSESGYGSSAFWNSRRTNANGRLGLSGNYKFLGFIQNPNSPKPTPAPVDPFPGVSDEELAARVWAGEFGNGQDRKNALGIRYSSVQALVEKGVGKPAPAPAPVGIREGDTVEIVGTGNGNSYGTSNTAYGIGWTRTVLKKYDDGRPFPYRVGNNTGTTGFYKESSLKKK